MLELFARIHLQKFCDAAASKRGFLRSKLKSTFAFCCSLTRVLLVSVCLCVLGRFAHAKACVCSSSVFVLLYGNLVFFFVLCAYWRWYIDNLLDYT